MATVTKGYTFGATETVTNAKLHSLVDSATVTAIVNADVDASAAIADTKLAQITTSSKVAVAAIVGTIPTSKGGTSATASANAANGVVVLDSNGHFTTIGASALTSVPAANLIGDVATINGGNLTSVVPFKIQSLSADPSSGVTGRIWLRVDL
jgi:hypothetical protein